MTRIEETFRKLKEKKKKAFISFVMGGDPNYEKSLEILKGLPNSGVDLIEIGIPFTDPMADGPSIQLAGQRAIAAGINVKSIFLSALYVVPIMRDQGAGVIINTASTAAVSPRPGLVWYNGSKGAVVTITKSMAVELAKDNIRVNAINPVIGDTGLTIDFMGGVDTPEIRQKFLATIPMGRMSTPLDIANAALFFASDESAFVTGVCLEVDGGRCV